MVFAYLPQFERYSGQGQAHHGVSSAVLLGIDHYQGFIETAEILSDRKAMRSLRRSLKQAGRGQWISHREVFGREIQRA